MNFLKIKRRNSLKIKVGNLEIGGDAPISVQSMTNTKTEDVQATLDQVKQLEDAGADLVRISVPNEEAATAFKLIKKDSNVPLIADIHFDYKMGILAAKNGADCLRINPCLLYTSPRQRD